MGCSEGEVPEVEVARESAGSPGGEVVEVGRLSGTSPGGTQATISLSPDPPRAGPVEVSIEFASPVEDPGSLTVDLVSPDMPAHGVMRHPVRPTDAGGEGGRYSATVPIPMEGLWNLYLNLDVGVEAVPFEFQVAPHNDVPPSFSGDDSAGGNEPVDHGQHHHH